jgi:hypothetical protein
MWSVAGVSDRAGPHAFNIAAGTIASAGVVPVVRAGTATSLAQTTRAAKIIGVVETAQKAVAGTLIQYPA